MKIKVFGYRGVLNSTSRIESELVKLGCELSEMPDVVIHLNGLFDDAEQFCAALPYKPKKIYQLLDIDHGKDISFYSGAREHLEGADYITFISKTAQKDICLALNIQNPNQEVVYFPMRPISHYNGERFLEFSFVGRAAPNKRIELALATVCQLTGGFELNIVGPEDVGYGRYFGILSDEDLNQFYNRSKFVFMTSAYEGIGLSAIEAIVNNCYCVVCNDCATVREFGLEMFAAEPNSNALAQKIVDIQNNPAQYDAKLNELRPRFIEMFDVKNVAARLYKIAEKLI